MAGTLRPDAEFQRFNTAKEKLGHYFRFKPRAALFNVVFMGLVPFGLATYAYNSEGQLSFNRRFRKDTVLSGEEYTPRDKDL
ncbi:uncharacterized protein CANTADRAFT_24933 [Suhomyces tanzawaensis NRRL Y-17324]|uniref:NADH-ubiquinone oxidoreductase B15 subunit n=1 Tax=Suhomyces tanzawaensis NRRL Y-17324 TaxID=984487 RepID=A0A1E4SSB4_9ASCO|nr:uncharacterized protein CANTADRAFT_24933 [Suhomyces tanzawaensis NRRL Y-17324]ODV82406.1 hypothetical protein CANTADRAFT_24933 [Suhomyces tanzawaensis NRRL Y-17324]